MRPIIYYPFPRPLPYGPTLALQQRIHELQLQQRRASPGSHDDILLLLEHRPVYTTGRRQMEADVGEDSDRLRNLGADFAVTKRGGQTTYHGPGQLVGYPLFDLARIRLSIAGYMAKIQGMLKLHMLKHHQIRAIDSDNTGVFSTPSVKLGSIGVQVRHRLTSHGFAYNVSREPLRWFDEVVACDLADVKAGCIADAGGREVSVKDDVEPLLSSVSQTFERDMLKLDTTRDGELERAVTELEAKAKESGSWLLIPK